MDKERKIFLLKNLSVYLGCILIGAICSVFLDFSIGLDNTILFLILTISALLLSWLINFILRKKGVDSVSKNNRLLLIVSVVIILLLRLFPSLYPKSLSELVMFLSFLLVVVSLQGFFILNKS